MKSYFRILSIAGSDSSGGAGIQADIKTISALGGYAMTAITAITAQNTTGVTAVCDIDPTMVVQQLEAIFTDVPPMAIKTGMLYDAPVIHAVAETLKKYRVKNLVIDPVMVSTSGSPLISDDAVDTLVSELFPLATLVTPNKAEAIRLTGTDNIEQQAQRLREMGCRNILLKGGDSDDMNVKTDYLITESSDIITALKADAVDTRNTHGTGCTLSAAIATLLALGYDIETAVSRAKLYTTKALRAGARVWAGHGHGPVNHFFGPRHMKYNFEPYSHKYEDNN